MHRHIKNIIGSVKHLLGFISVFPNTLCLFGKQSWWLLLLSSSWFELLLKQRLSSTIMEVNTGAAFKAGQQNTHLISCQPIITPEVLYGPRWWRQWAGCWVLHTSWISIHWPTFTFCIRWSIDSMLVENLNIHYWCSTIAEMNNAGLANVLWTGVALK